MPRQFPPLLKQRAETLQFNIGRHCNQACHHCHVDSSPKRSGSHENAQARLLAKVLELLERAPSIRTLDLTGGAPELNAGFRGLVRAARALERQVLVRHNLTVQDQPGQADLPQFFASQQVVLFCSLPCYLEENVDAQRGRGVFEHSLEALRRLNAVGYGDEGGGLELNLVYNPLGASLPPPQPALQADYRRELAARYGIRFQRLVTITNQPIHRFRQDLERRGRLEEYQQLLENSFNSATLPELMCRSAISLRWDGRLHDCDFNLVLGLPLHGRDGAAWTIDDLLRQDDPADLAGLPITTAAHCFACTAGAGSSCGGALVDASVATAAVHAGSPA
ncbi:MAG TPA: arsenosugar biosynthesis radical SAM (seleno)protein ArsS [Planctomycetota bacterium]